MEQSNSVIGQVIDGYRILEVLGKGGMGIVYKAEDVALSRTVALKMIAPELATNESFLRRFHSEARALARAENPYIVGVHALRKAGERVFIVMEYVDGWTLADEIEKGPMEMARTHSLLEQMLHAFIRAHSEGVIHRDIKPRNIMITRAGKVKVTDFGLAKLRRDDGASTVTQGMAGTVRYMSPEQVQGAHADHRSDIYSLGMTMYEMLAGQLPFGFDEGTFTILKRIVEEQFPSPEEFNANIPRPLANIALKAISKKPEERYQSAEEMLMALGNAFKQTTTASGPSYISVSPRTRPARKKANAVLMAIGVVLLLAAYPVYSFFTGPTTTPDTRNGGNLPLFPANDSLRAPELSVSSRPVGAMVYVADSLIGPAPLTRLAVSEGEVRVSVRLTGYDRVDTLLTMSPGQHTSLQLELAELKPLRNPSPDRDPIVVNPPDDDEPKPATGSIRLRAHPAGRITIAGQSYRDNASTTLPVGPHSIRFDDPSTGVSRDTLITIRADQRTELTCYFQHEVSISTRWDQSPIAPFASFSINDGSLEQTPKVVYLGPGRYRIEASRQGHSISNAEQVLVIGPTFDISKTIHKVFFEIRKEE